MAADPGAPAASDVLVEARERWKRCEEAEKDQREAIRLAKKFRAGDQWPDAVKEARQGAPAISGQSAQPPRPCLTIARLSPAVRQTANDIKSANFAIKYLPNGYGADNETAKIYNGIVRRIQAECRDEDPVGWAAEGS